MGKSHHCAGKLQANHLKRIKEKAQKLLRNKIARNGLSRREFELQEKFRKHGKTP